MSRPGIALNGDAPKAMVAKILGFQAKEEEESQETIQQLNTNVRTLVKCQGCRMNAKAAMPRLQCQGCRSRSVTINIIKSFIYKNKFNFILY